MKKAFEVIMVGLFVIMLSVINVNGEETVKITKVNCSNMYGGVVNNNLSATTSGLDIKVDDSHFINTGDYTKCTLDITNDSVDDVSVDAKSISNLSNDNVSYELTSEGDNSIAKGKSATYQLNINYRKEYSEDKVLDNVVEIKLSGNTVVNNPTTSSTFLVVIGIILVILIGTYIVIFTKKDNKKMLILLIIGSSILIPSVKALTQVTIKLENKIIIEYPEYHVYYKYSDGYISATDFGNYDASETVCDKDSSGNYIIYNLVMLNPTSYTTAMGSIINKYYKCSVLVADMGKYKVGSQVNLVSQNKLSLSSCTLQDNVYNCSSKTNITTSYIWRYGKVANYDKTVMNFTNGLISDAWDANNYFDFEVPNTFTMPDHKVVFSEVIWAN